MCSHGHSHGGCGAEHIPEVGGDDVYRYDMVSYIDLDKVTTLNESIDGAGRKVFKMMEMRDDKTDYVESDCDAELLFNIPFTGHVRLHGLSIIGDEDASHPAKIKLFKDKEAMSFDDCSIEADQEIDLKQDPRGIVDYPLKASKFANLHHLSILITANFAGTDSETKVFYIGLRGEFQHEFRQRVAIATYESRAQLKDHKNEIPGQVTRSIL
uniref:PITH domain-containing protein n=1 Tax=Caenorhabditis japonica TaxID=281687 RepID=A0A8R1EE58_CAEJA